MDAFLVDTSNLIIFILLLALLCLLIAPALLAFVPHPLASSIGTCTLYN
jgi:hypothetical protein